MNRITRRELHPGGRRPDELLLDSDLEAYKRKKQDLSNALAKHKAQLRYMNVLMGNEAFIQSIINSLNQKLTDLVHHEEAIINCFTILMNTAAASAMRG